jgi:folylpolyglutamate synthase/dihydropteroate synthase
MSTIDLSLTRIRSLSTHLPPYTRPTIHIAGTNGKGSVSALLTSILSALRIGRFNSPHLVHIHDCISINNHPVSHATYTSARRQVEDADTTHGTCLSSFELLTLTALQIFEDVAVDVVILEVGMGGLLDATNIISTSTVLCSVLTAVDLDHQAFLGTTVAQIARHKAGIARPGRPFVLGPQNDDSIQQVVEEVVLHAGGTLLRSPRVRADNGNSSSASGVPPPPQRVHATLESFPDRPICASFPLQGDHQLDNLSTALGVIDTLLLLSSKSISESLPNADPDLIEMFGTLNLPSRLTPETIELGIQDVQWPGRLSFHLLHIPIHPMGNPTTTLLLVLADGAHNPASAHTLGAYISRLQSTAIAPITYILALSHSPPKIPHDTLAPILAPLVSSPSAPPNLKPGIALLPFTPPAGMPWVRPVDPHVLRETVVQLFRSVAPEEASSNQVEIRIFDNDTNSPEANTSELPDININTSEGFYRPLLDALRWAAARHRPVGAEDPASQPSRGLVVLAGSLYLVADLYRLLEGRFGLGG